VCGRGQDCAQAGTVTKKKVASTQPYGENKYKGSGVFVWQILTALSQAVIAFLRSVSTALPVGMYKRARAG
jgi:hypothetical protein